MNNEAENLNAALEKMRRGVPLDEILAAFPDAQRQNLKPQMELAAEVLSMPKKEIPEPSMRRKYLLAPARAAQFSWLRLSRYAWLSYSMAIIVCALAGTGYAASRSLPGDPLFSVKKTAESLQVKLASNPDDKANLQMELAQKRFSDAEKILKNPYSNPKQEKAALTELITQTQTAIEQANAAAHSNPVSEKTHPLVASLENINVQQQNLIKEAKLGLNAGTDTQSALAAVKENANKVAEIKRYISVASNEQFPAALDANASTTEVSGVIGKISANEIVINGTSFALSSSTVITGPQNNVIEISSLKTGVTANITTGQTQGGRTIALRITILDMANIGRKGEVKGTSTADVLKTPESTASSSSPEDIGNANSDTSTPETLTDPNTAVGAYILEDPAPQAAIK
ncbi:MAG: DUF5667 domain-containing protein [Patescibacteria group bacterium]|nr:DUF5667 domain-containing protein [Patescibacteria group bacterium]